MWIYILVASVVAIAFVNKSKKVSNWNLLWIVPVLAFVLWIAFSVVGAIFSWIIVPLLIVGVIFAAFLYLKDKVTPPNP
jgi:predicted branched-subunit amino acid permease